MSSHTLTAKKKTQNKTKKFVTPATQSRQKKPKNQKNVQIQQKLSVVFWLCSIKKVSPHVFVLLCSFCVHDLANNTTSTWPTDGYIYHVRRLTSHSDRDKWGRTHHPCTAGASWASKLQDSHGNVWGVPATENTHLGQVLAWWQIIIHLRSSAWSI